MYICNISYLYNMQYIIIILWMFSCFQGSEKSLGILRAAPCNVVSPCQFKESGDLAQEVFICNCSQCDQRWRQPVKPRQTFFSVHPDAWSVQNTTGHTLDRVPIWLWKRWLSAASRLVNQTTHTHTHTRRPSPPSTTTQSSQFSCRSKFSSSPVQLCHHCHSHWVAERQGGRLLKALTARHLRCFYPSPLFTSRP